MLVYHHLSIYLACRLVFALCEAVCTGTPVNTRSLTCRKLPWLPCSLLRMGWGLSPAFLLHPSAAFAPQVCALPSISEQRLGNGCCPGLAGRKSWMVPPELSRAPAFRRHLQTTCLVRRPDLWSVLENMTLFCCLFVLLSNSVCFLFDLSPVRRFSPVF